MARRTIPSPILVIGDYALVELNRSLVSIIDKADVELVEGFIWHTYIGGTVRYVQSNAVDSCGRHSMVRMHRIIMGVTDAHILVDHINGDGLDNRRSNLRICTKRQNACNQKLSSANKSGYKGVHLSRHGNWYACIKSHGKTKKLGTYASKEAAAMAYNEAAVEMFGEFANLNHIQVNQCQEPRSQYTAK